MGCISPREQEDFAIQVKEMQMQLVLFSIDNIRNGFFYLNDGDNICEEHLYNGFANMQNFLTNFLTKYTESDELFKKFVIPFKKPDDNYQYREIIICLYLNSKNKSIEKAKAIAELLFKNKEELTLDDLKDLFQKIFKSVLSYSYYLIKEAVKPKEVEEEKKTEETQQQQKQENNNKEEEEQKKDDAKEQQAVTDQKLDEKNQEIIEEKKNTEKEEENQDLKLQIKKALDKDYFKDFQIYLDLGEEIANNIAESFFENKEEKLIKLDQFAEKCKSHIPDKFGRDIMCPKGVRLTVYKEFDKKGQQQ